jgi:hypothetical protein
MEHSKSQDKTQTVRAVGQWVCTVSAAEVAENNQECDSTDTGCGFKKTREGRH